MNMKTVGNLCLGTGIGNLGTMLCTKVLRMYSPRTFFNPMKVLRNDDIYVDIKAIEADEEWYDRKNIYIIPSLCEKDASNILLKAFGGKKVFATLGEATKEEKAHFEKSGKHTNGLPLYSFVLKDGCQIDKKGIAYLKGNLVGHMEGYWDLYKAL